MVVKKIFKDHPVAVIIASLFILGSLIFEFWNHYSPRAGHDWNKREISRIKVDPTDFYFAVFGDNKGHDSGFQPLLRIINQDKKIGFAMDLGDLVREGRRWYFRRFVGQLQKNLTIPFLGAIGNHDLYKGSGNYQEFFGPTYYSFQIGQSYFIVLDAAEGRTHFDKAERQWLEDELQRSQASKIRFIFMHVPLFDPREGLGYKCLPEEDGRDLLALFKRYQVTHLFASHIHGYFSGLWEGVPYTITGGAGAGLQGEDPRNFFHHYVEVHVSGGKVEMEPKRIYRETRVKDVVSYIADCGPEWGLLPGALISLFVLGLSLRRDYNKSKRKPL
jgi:hypothetical protein